MCTVFCLLWHKGFAHQRLLPTVNRVQPDGQGTQQSCVVRKSARFDSHIARKQKPNSQELGFVGVA